MTERVFEVAWFWHLDPAIVMSLPLSKFQLYEQQAHHLAEKMRLDQHG